MNLQPVCLPKSGHSQHSKNHISLLFTHPFVFKDLNSTYMQANYVFKMWQQSKFLAMPQYEWTPCTTELSLKCDPILREELVITRYISVTCPLYGCRCYSRSIWSCLRIFCSAIITICLLISTTKKATWTMCQEKLEMTPCQYYNPYLT